MPYTPYYFHLKLEIKLYLKIRNKTLYSLASIVTNLDS